VTPDLLRVLAAACAGADAAVPQTGPLPGAYRRSALPALQRRLAAGRLSLRGALGELDTRIVELDEALLADVDTRDDLRRLLTVPGTDPAVPGTVPPPVAAAQCASEASTPPEAGRTCSRSAPVPTRVTGTSSSRSTKAT
jgi:hypothetical protein